MSRNSPQVRTINMLSEFQPPDGEHGTQAFFRALSEADGFCREVEHAQELACRCDELTALVAEIKTLHPRHVEQGGAQACSSCLLDWPCPTIQLIENRPTNQRQELNREK